MVPRPSRTFVVTSARFVIVALRSRYTVSSDDSSLPTVPSPRSMRSVTRRMFALAASKFATIDFSSPPDVISLRFFAIDDTSRIQSVGVSPLNSVDSSGMTSPSPSSSSR